MGGGRRVVVNGEWPSRHAHGPGDGREFHRDRVDVEHGVVDLSRPAAA